MSNRYGSRYGQRTKKRKANIILNSLIGLVFILIVVVAANIFLGGDKEKVIEQENPPTEEQGTTPDEEEQEGETEPEPIVEGEEDENSQEVTAPETTEDDERNVEEPNEYSEEGQVVIGGDPSSNVIQTIINPNWRPVGTVQEGVHTNVYDGIDWDEMVEAITYATGLEKENMTIHFLGNNGHNKSVGTVYSKNKQEIYRVYIEWIDQEGWKPEKVEQLASIEEAA